MYKDLEKSQKGYYAVKGDKEAPYPRICAHRGFKTIAPENSLPAFGAAIALGAPEIEMDIRFTSDGVPVVAHDSALERVSNGEGVIEEHTLAQLKNLDFGGKFHRSFASLPVLLFEEVLERFARQAIINLHLKTDESGGGNYPEDKMKKLIDLLEKYDACNHVYWMGCTAVMRSALKLAPEIPRCMGAFPDPWKIVDRAIEYECAKAQLFTPYYNEEMIEKAHKNGIKCNFFFTDDPEEAVKLLAMGIDTILTNDYWPIANRCREFIEGKQK